MKILYYMALKHYLVKKNYILIKLLFLFCFVLFFIFQSHYIISYFLLPSKYTRQCQEIIFNLSFKCKLHANLFNLCAENSAIAYDKYYILISDTGGISKMECLILSDCNFWMTGLISKI